MYLSQDDLCRVFLTPEQINELRSGNGISEFRFRPVRGGLNEALVRQASFYDISDLYRYVAFCVCDPPVSLSDIYTKKYSDSDYRIGWFNIHIVMVKKDNGDFPVGYVSFKPCTKFGTLFHDDIVSDDFI